MATSAQKGVTRKPDPPAVKKPIFVTKCDKTTKRNNGRSSPDSATVNSKGIGSHASTALVSASLATVKSTQSTGDKEDEGEFKEEEEVDEEMEEVSTTSPTTAMNVDDIKVDPTNYADQKYKDVKISKRKIFNSH